MYTISDLCKISKLSRSTLLYYDSLGLVKPVKRSRSNYRYYSEESILTLRRICLYRDAGVSLSNIIKLISTTENVDRVLDIYEKTLRTLNDEAKKIRKKQRRIIKLIKMAKDGAYRIEEDDNYDFEENRRRIAAFAFDPYEYLSLYD